MTQRYYCEEPIVPPKVVLTGSEANHFMKVMRGKIGEKVVVFDGRGVEYDAVVISTKRHGVVLNVTAVHAVDRELPTRLIVAVPLPKGDRQRWLVEKAVELGVTSFVPLRTRRSIAQPRSETLPRFRRWVVEASKQCGRNKLMEIEEPRDWEEFLETTPNSANRLLADSGGEWQISGSLFHASPIYLAVGPEGGFTAEEIASARERGWRPISLGPRILRVETAVLALAAIISRAVVETQ